MSRLSWAMALASPLLLAPAPPSAPRATACSQHLFEDGVRTRAIQSLLSTDPEASALLASSAGRVTLCFGAVDEPSVTSDGALLLEASQPAPEAAARVAHLLHHRRAGSPLAGRPSGDCARWVEAALDEEAQAHALEIRLLVAAGRPAGFPFAAEAWAAPEDQRVDIIHRWLREHPAGFGGVPALATSYQSRCVREEEESR
jgi:hypothetical protein